MGKAQESPLPCCVKKTGAKKEKTFLPTAIICSGRRGKSFLFSVERLATIVLEDSQEITFERLAVSSHPECHWDWETIRNVLRDNLLRY